MDADKLTDTELLERLKGCPKPGTRWVHYKTGNVYVVTGRVILESAQEPHVTYQREEGNVPFARPLPQWTEIVEWDGKRVPRFTPA